MGLEITESILGEFIDLCILNFKNGGHIYDKNNEHRYYELKQQIRKNERIVDRLAVFTDEFGHLPCNAFPNWIWWKKLTEDVWENKK